MKQIYFLLSLSACVAQLAPASAIQDEEAPVVYQQVQAIKRTFLSDPSMTQRYDNLLAQLDFSNDEMSEIDQDRIEAAALFVNFNNPEKALELLDYNIQSHSVEFDYRVFSLVFACFSQSADLQWIKDRIPCLTLTLNSYEDDILSALFLGVLNYEVGQVPQAQRIWEASVDCVNPETAEELWETVLKKSEKLGIKSPRTPLLGNKSFAEIYPFLREYLQAHTKRNIAKFSRSKPPKSNL